MLELNSITIPRNFTEFQLTALKIYYQLKILFLATYCTQGSLCLNGSVCLARDIFVGYVVYTQLLKLYRVLRGYGIIDSIRRLYLYVSSTVSSQIFSLPFIKSKIDKELQATIGKVEEEIMKNDPQLLQFPELPEQGIDADNVSLELDKLQNLKHSDWINGRVSGAVYH